MLLEIDKVLKLCAAPAAGVTPELGVQLPVGHQLAHRPERLGAQLAADGGGLSGGGILLLGGGGVLLPLLLVLMNKSKRRWKSYLEIFAIGKAGLEISPKSSVSVFVIALCQCDIVSVTVKRSLFFCDIV